MRSSHLFRSAAPIALGTALLLSLFVGVARSPQALAAAPTRAGAIARSAAGSSQLAATPPMSFNTWNAFGCRINEATVHAIADTMVADGLLKKDTPRGVWDVTPSVGCVRRLGQSLIGIPSLNRNISISQGKRRSCTPVALLF